MPTFPAIIPDWEGPVVRNGAGGGREMMMMRWDFRQRHSRLRRRLPVVLLLRFELASFVSERADV